MKLFISSLKIHIWKIHSACKIRKSRFISKKYYTICSLLEVLKYGKTNTEKLESFATAYNGYANFVLENADYNVGKKDLMEVIHHS